MRSDKILFVDDDPAMRAACRRTLQRHDLSVDVAESADEARALAHEQSYAVIAVDYSMPGDNGLELIADLRSTQHHATYVLVSGGCNIQLGSPDAGDHGISYVIPKPWDVEEMVSVVQRSLQDHRDRADSTRR